MKKDENDYKSEAMKNALDIAGKNFTPSDYESEDPVDKAMAVTHEQASDVFTEGTSDGKIDELDENAELKTHHGKALRRRGFDN